MEINKKEIVKDLMFQIKVYRQFGTIIESDEHMENIVEEIIEKYI